MKDKDIKYEIISDPGVDDIIALLLVNKLSPVAKHRVISTFGNVPEEHTSRNLREFVSFVAPHWSYSRGPDKPLQPLEHSWPTYFHGEDGVWNIHPSVEINEVKEQEKFPVSGRIISLGPMTEIYNIFRQKTTISKIIIMGGAFNVAGNETKYAETNIAFDPDAANHCFSSCQGIDVKVVPLDVTRQVFWTKEKVLTIPEDDEHKVWAKRLLLAWFENYGDKNKTNFDLHDPLAIYSIFFPNDFQWKTSGIKVIIQGTKRGQTILEPKNPKCKVSLGISNSRSVADIIFDLIFG